MESSKINFGKILFGVFIFLAIFGFVQLLKDNGRAQNDSLNQNLKVSPADSRWPNDWVMWSDIFEGESVYKYGPKFSETDFVITMPTKLIQSLPEGSSCVGDSEKATCVVGQDAEVRGGFNKWSNI